MKNRLLLLLTILTVLTLSKTLLAHCEIPCGIYNDELRFELLAEHITTIEKSMTKISELSAQNDINQNQLVRWINNKEAHASKFITIVTQYFMTQRVKVIKPDADGYNTYVKKITLLHSMIISSMKCKQTIDLKHTKSLLKLLTEFKTLYLVNHKH